jgi:acyl dehydratase
MWQPFVGKQSTTEINWVERGVVRAFAEAIGDLNPLYVDEEVAKKSRYHRCMAPPTFPRTFRYGTIPGLPMPASGLIHGQQVFHYRHRLFVGDQVFCYQVLKDFYEKVGSLGRLSFLVFECVGEDHEEECLFTCTETYIITEIVRKSMEG